MVTYEDWVAISFELASDDVSPQRVFSRAGEVWQMNKSTLKGASMSQARDIGRRDL